MNKDKRRDSKLKTHRYWVALYPLPQFANKKEQKQSEKIRVRELIAIAKSHRLMRDMLIKDVKEFDGYIQQLETMV